MASMNSDPLGMVYGLAPRSVRWWTDLDMQRPAPPPPPAEAPVSFADMLQNLHPVDAVTADLRRRVAEAATVRPRRRSLKVTAPLVAAGFAIVLWQVISNIAVSMPLTP